MGRIEKDRIKRYINKDLSAAEQQSFESDMEKYPDLKMEYFLYKSVHSDIKTMARVEEILSDPDLENALKQAGEAITDYHDDTSSRRLEKNKSGSENEPMLKIIKSGAKKQRNLFLYFISAAAAAIFIAFILKNIFPSADQDMLYNQYYAKFEMPIDASRGNVSDSRVLLIRAYNAYKNGNITESAGFLSGIEEDMKDNSLYLYISGLVFMEQGNYTEAIMNFTTNSGYQDALFYEKQWYLGLCYLKLGDIENSEKSFRFLEKNYSIFQEDAEHLLRDINRLPK